jgi:hydroxysqualene dehydroxylase
VARGAEPRPRRRDPVAAMSARRVAVVGGGLAGITAALDCSRSGAEVVVLESRGRLGGQVYSFTRDGLHVDNGQHVFLRCCTAYRELLERIGATEMVALQPRLELPVLAPNRPRAVLRRANLPPPLHMATSLARYGMLSGVDRLRAARAMRALGAVDRDDPAVDAQSLGDWLSARRQGPRARAALWELIARPTLNLQAADASLAQAAQVFQTGLLTSSSGGDVGYARVPLSKIHDQATRRALQDAGVQVRLRCGVTAITSVAGGFELEISGAPTVAADTVILAVPWDRCARLLPPGCGIAPGNLTGLGRSPIVNLHVVYDRRVLDVPFAAGVESPVQWLFDRTASSGCSEGQYLVVSLSAADEDLPLSVEQLQARYVPALAELLGTDAQIRKFFVTRDHAATFRAAPGSRAMRPPARTNLPGLVLAGSWTDTGWPATMEGAVRSGHAAAREALAGPTVAAVARDNGVPSSQPASSNGGAPSNGAESGGNESAPEIPVQGPA